MNHDELQYYYGLLCLKKDQFSIEQIQQIVKNEQQNVISLTGEEDLGGYCKYLSIRLQEHFTNLGYRMIFVALQSLIEDAGEHYFLLTAIPTGNALSYVLIDATYNQFVNKENQQLLSRYQEWPDTILRKTEEGKKISETLIRDGVKIVTEEEFACYIKALSNSSLPYDVTLENLFFNMKGSERGARK